MNFLILVVNNFKINMKKNGVKYLQGISFLQLAVNEKSKIRV